MLCCHYIKNLHILDPRWKGLIYILSSGGLISSIGESTSKLHTVEFVALHVVVMSSLTNDKWDISPCLIKKKKDSPMATCWGHCFLEPKYPGPIATNHVYSWTYWRSNQMSVNPHDDILNGPLTKLSHHTATGWLASKWFRARRF